MDFGSLGQFATHLASLEVAVHHETKRGLSKVAAIIEKEAKSEIGTYQPSAGPFPAWEQLAMSTKQDRVRKGFTANDPLLRSGELRDSISHEVASHEAVIGSTSDVAVFQEMGTDKIPPRPFLGPAGFKSEAAIRSILGVALMRGLLGGQVIPAGLGYERDVS